MTPFDWILVIIIVLVVTITNITLYTWNVEKRSGDDRPTFDMEMEYREMIVLIGRIYDDSVCYNGKIQWDTRQLLNDWVNK